MAVTLNLQLAGNWVFAFFFRRCWMDSCKLFQNLRRIVMVWVLFLGISCAVCVQSHIQVVHFRNSFLMKACRLVLKELLMRRRKSWRDLPDLREIYVTHLNSTHLPFHHHFSSCASRCATGTAPSWCCGEWEWERCLLKKRRGNRDLVKPSKIAPGYGAKQGHIQQIWWMKFIGTFVLYLVPEKWPLNMRSGLNDWIILDLDGFRSTGFQICPKHLPLLWVYLAPLFDHIWLLPKSRVIEVPNKRFCKYPKKSSVSSSFNVTCAKIPVAHRVKPKKEGSRILCGYISRWRYGCLTWCFNTWWFTLITASLEKKHWLFFPYSFPLSFRHGAGQALGGFADGGLSWRHVAWWRPESLQGSQLWARWKIWHPTRRVPGGNVLTALPFGWSFLTGF